MTDRRCWAVATQCHSAARQSSRCSAVADTAEESKRAVLAVGEEDLGSIVVEVERCCIEQDRGLPLPTQYRGKVVDPADADGER